MTLNLKPLNLKTLKLSLALLAMSCLSPAFMSAPAWAQSDPLATPISAEDALEGDKEGDVTEKAMEDDDGVENSSVENPSDESQDDAENNTQTKTVIDNPELTVDTVEYTLTEAPDDHVLGDDKAPITMIVYASVTCSHCADWFTNQWPAVKKDLVDGGKIRFVLRPLPTPPAQMSMVGFMMAECAPKEDYFDVVQYQMENQLMMFKQAEIGKVREEYDKVARLAGLEDEAAIQACFQDLEKLKHIHTSGDRATAAKVQGVPAFFINGDNYKGDQSADALTKLILEMSEKGQSKLPTTLP